MLCRMGLYAEDKKEKYQMAELQHGRLAMIAIGGMIRARAASPRNAATPRARPIARPRRTPNPPRADGSFVTGCGVVGSTN